MKLKIEDKKLKIELNPLEMLLSFKGSIEVPLSHITSASPKKPDGKWQIRAPGAYIPYLIKSGTYHDKQGKEFWFTTLGKDYLAIELSNWDFNWIVLTIGDNKIWAERINQELENL